MRMLRIVRVTVKDGVGELCFIVLYFVCGSLSGYLHSTSTSVIADPLCISNDIYTTARLVHPSPEL